MAHNYKIALLLFLFSVCFACKKENTAPAPAPHVNTMSAKVNGAPFVITNIKALTGNHASGTQLNIYGVSANNHQIVVGTLNYTKSTGNYAVGGNAIAAYYESLGFNGGFYGYLGQVSITRVDNTTYRNGSVVDGNFSFTTKSDFSTTEGNYVVTDGKFSVFVEK